ncbi:DUF3429 domain-containing protein [Porphyrobacter sp. AAP82]|uniref:DUF3429 domain-containing protein n=1 Tax=Porphyrobacter sp. AAP82 TaxID=1248917 RepID=UPI0002E90F20|nr:DUF3429 domain-containing protein [Porphyrobacter sp. AAP82]
MNGQEQASSPSLSTAALVLGYAGLLPQLLCVGMLLIGHEWRYAALAGGYAYAAAIFSFLGGVWWGQALASAKDGKPATTGAYVLAVLPSLVAVALFLPWSFGWEWPGPALLYLGALILGSPLVDRALGFAARDFLRLRWHLSAGLGSLTIALGLLAPQVI